MAGLALPDRRRPGLYLKKRFPPGPGLYRTNTFCVYESDRVATFTT